MPFTPLHLSPGLIIYLLLFPCLDLLALMVATIFIDVEPFNLWVFDLVSYLLLWPHVLLCMSSLVLTPIAYIRGIRLHGEKPFSHFP